MVSSTLNGNVAFDADSIPGTSLRKMKGVGFANVRNFVIAKHGQDKWAAVLRLLADRDRQVAESALPVGWYEVACFGRLLRAIDGVCGCGDLKFLPRVGANEAEQDFNRVFRVFLKALSPQAFFSAERKLWKHFHDSGVWSLKSSRSSLEAELEGWEVDEALCVELAGYLARIIEFTGGRSVTFQHACCRARGNDSCVFLFNWR